MKPLSKQPSSSFVRKRARRVLGASGRLKVCAWCGEKQTFLTTLHVHHRDHRSESLDLKNLQYLCPTCHWLETWIWHARKQGRIETEVFGNQLLITLPRVLAFSFPDSLEPYEESTAGYPSRGAALGIAREELRASLGPEECAWCAQEAEKGESGKSRSLQAHHLNHAWSDNRPENLTWLCRTCHMLETRIWEVWEQGKVKVEKLGVGCGLLLTFHRV